MVNRYRGYCSGNVRLQNAANHRMFFSISAVGVLPLQTLIYWPVYMNFDE